MPIWDCPLCGQAIEIGTGKRPPGYFETCLLREHMVGDECLAYRQPEKALELSKQKGDDAGEPTDGYGNDAD
jgi:hypothetical protein